MVLTIMCLTMCAIEFILHCMEHADEDSIFTEHCEEGEHMLFPYSHRSLEAAKAVIMDLLAFRADRDRYYYGMDTMFDRHPDLVKRSTESRYGLRLCVL